MMTRTWFLSVNNFAWQKNIKNQTGFSYLNTEKSNKTPDF